jgi:hypothetical protein
MISKELMQPLRESDRQVKAAKTAIEDSSKTGMHFVNLELDLSLAFAERALASSPPVVFTTQSDPHRLRKKRTEVPANFFTN